ncbi:MAG: hypothetical protein U0359_31955 [Byssovorax sp.]
MSTGRYLAMLCGLLGGTGLVSAGCSHYVDDYYTPLTKITGIGTGGSGGTGSTTGTGGTSGTGGTGGGAPSCVPSENDKAVADTCGVFVSSSTGEDGKDRGAKDKPFKTLSAAIMAAADMKKPVYACGELFKEVVTISSGVVLYGALDCTKEWVYQADKKTGLTADPDAVPVTLASTAGGTMIHDFSITAADAMVDGGSSIALVDDQAELMLENVTLNAGKGKAGAGGAVQSQVATPVDAKGGDGADNMCGVQANVGGNPGINTCLYMGNMVDVSGGAGGTGTNSMTGGNGQDGNPLGAAGKGGVGQTALQCQPGQPGSQGPDGIAGSGARGIGDIDATGYHGPLASKGTGESSPGQGGGGGGGAKKCVAGGSGPGGGGGGAGGCGGAPGNAGQSGGSSIGILALSAKLTLKTVTINTKDGESGGVGGDGQLGAAGGQPGGAGGANACPGNIGGAGGRGGSGGGGAGGHSIGLAMKGGTLPALDSTTIKLGQGAPGAIGGDMDMTPQTKGDDGKTCTVLDFTDLMSPTACMK